MASFNVVQPKELPASQADKHTHNHTEKPQLRIKRPT